MAGEHPRGPAAVEAHHVVAIRWHARGGSGFTHAPHLNGQYTVWGKVIEGMQYVDQIAKGEPPANPDVMQKVYLLADAKK